MLIVGGTLFHKMVAGLFGRTFHVVGNIDKIVVSAECGLIVDDRFHVHEIDETVKKLSRPDGDGEGQRVGAESFLHHVDHIVKVRPHPIHLVDKSDARNLVLICLTPDCFALRLNAANSTEDYHGAVKDTE